jgi:hypothetical protein
VARACFLQQIVTEKSESPNRTEIREGRKSLEIISTLGLPMCQSEATVTQHSSIPAILFPTRQIVVSNLCQDSVHTEPEGVSLFSPLFDMAAYVIKPVGRSTTINSQPRPRGRRDAQTVGNAN